MPYLNSEVFYRTLPTAEFDLVDLPPRAMAAAVERGDLDAGPLPLAEVFRLGELLRTVGDFCVATGERANSVHLLSRVAVGALSGKTVAVTPHTATSVQLLRVLFADHWHVSPARYVEPGDPHDARLTIGDEALRLRHDHPGYPFIYDLGEEWRRLTGLPFVFAVWAIRADAGVSARSQLETALARSLAAGLARLESIAQERATSHMTASDVVEYIRSFIYHLGPEERRAVAEFKARLGKLPEWRPGVPTPAQTGA